MPFVWQWRGENGRKSDGGKPPQSAGVDLRRHGRYFATENASGEAAFETGKRLTSRIAAKE